MTLTPWNYAEIWQSIAAVQPELPALVQGDRVVSWGEFETQADALAANFLAAGLTRQSKVACYLYNCPEYLITMYAAFKAGMAPFNVNYRYGPDELYYLLNDADAEAVVFDAEFAARLDVIRGRLPKLKRWIAVARPDAAIPPWARDYDDVVLTAVDGPVQPPWGRSGEDLLILYTGGTTGLPKGVMWRQEDLFGATNYGAIPALGVPPLESPEDAPARAMAGARQTYLIAPPLMHGTGMMSAIAALTTGGTATFLPSRRFDAMELWSEVERLRATRLAIVGMAFCTPMLEALDAHPGRWDLTSLRLIGSSGAMWSQENKQGLIRHMPHVALADSFASSEAFGMGLSTSTAAGQSETARFVVGENCAVFTEDFRRVTPGSGERGKAAVAGHIPVGYYNDPKKTAETFPIIEGRRWSMPGDWATVNAEGGLEVLGRGSQCINTGGEKVFPEEVEEALKRHEAVRDAAVVGLPDPRFDEVIWALVELKRDAAEPRPDDLRAFVKSQLADYKAPRHVVFVETVGRAPNGKLDYKAVKAVAQSHAGARV